MPNNSVYNHNGAPMSEPVLVLNANFQPINITTTYRAINLLLSENNNVYDLTEILSQLFKLLHAEEQCK